MQLGITIDTDLEQFLDGAVPVLLRRMHGWRSRCDLDELAHDLRQELIVDWLARREQLRPWTPQQRNRYWLRLLSRAYYQLVVRTQRGRARGQDLDLLPGPVATPDPLSPATEIGPFDRAQLLRIATNRCELRNGRFNLQRSAEAVGLTTKELRRLWQRLARELGYDEEFQSFWRRRLVEALLGLTCDLLRERGLVRLCNETKRLRPDPAGRLLRIRRIRDVLSICPQSVELRDLFVPYTRNGALASLDPRRTIADAQALAPHDPDVLLWSFEVAIAHGQLRGATWLLRRMPRLAVPRVRWWLARARLLEARGRLAAARALITRKLPRLPRDPRLLAVATAFATCSAPVLQASSASTSASSSSSSNRGSPRADVQDGSPNTSNRSTATSTTTASSPPSR